MKHSPTTWELYDVAADPGEENDLAKQRPAVVTRLAGEYDRWWQSVQPDLVNENVPVPAVNPFKAAYEQQCFRLTFARKFSGDPLGEP